MKIIRTIETETTWAEIKSAVENSKESSLLESGNKFPVELKNGEKVTFVTARDENGNLFFVLEDCLNDKQCMNINPTNKGGWGKCEMREYLNTTIFALLPDELQAVITPTKIVQVLDGERVESKDKLFLLSKTQVFGKGRYSKYEPEDSHFDIFKSKKDRAKWRGDVGTDWWWLRSPYSQSSINFYFVNDVGASSDYSAYYTFGVAFGFSL